MKLDRNQEGLESGGGGGGEPKLEGVEEGEDRFEGEVGPLESDGCGSNPAQPLITGPLPASSSVRTAPVCLKAYLWELYKTKCVKAQCSAILLQYSAIVKYYYYYRPRYV